MKKIVQQDLKTLICLDEIIQKGYKIKTHIPKERRCPYCNKLLEPKGIVNPLDKSLHKGIYTFRLFVNSNGSEVARSTEKWSMIPPIYPDIPCDKPLHWDGIPSYYKRPKGK